MLLEGIKKEHFRDKCFSKSDACLNFPNTADSATLDCYIYFDMGANSRKITLGE